MQRQALLTRPAPPPREPQQPIIPPKPRLCQVCRAPTDGLLAHKRKPLCSFTCAARLARPTRRRTTRRQKGLTHARR